MLPIHHKNMVSLILHGPGPDDSGGPAESGSSADGGGDEGLHAAAEELISAVHSKDAGAVVSALKAAFEMLDSGPEEAAEAEETGE